MVGKKPPVRQVGQNRDRLAPTTIRLETAVPTRRLLCTCLLCCRLGLQLQHTGSITSIYRGPGCCCSVNTMTECGTAMQGKSSPCRRSSPTAGWRGYQERTENSGTSVSVDDVCSATPNVTLFSFFHCNRPSAACAAAQTNQHTSMPQAVLVASRQQRRSVAQERD